jgi:hypothetical protein
MQMARDAKLTGHGSHWVADEYRGADGISKEEVFPRFSAKWRGRDVHGTISADRYSAGMDSGSQQLTDWRIYVREAWELDESKSGGRGAELSGTARAALRELLEPMVRDWLRGDEYRDSFRRALAHTVLRRLRDDSRYRDAGGEALATFRGRMAPEHVQALEAAIAAHGAYLAAEAAAGEAINPGSSS